MRTDVSFPLPHCFARAGAGAPSPSLLRGFASKIHTKARVLSLQLQRLLEDTGEIKGTAAFVYGCEVGRGAKDSMNFRAPPAAGIKIESEVIHQQQDSARYKQLDHSLANRL